MQPENEAQNAASSRFPATTRKTRESPQQISVMILTDTIMSAKPVSGETTAPKMNRKKPMMAEALPALGLSSVRANEVEVGNIIPRATIIRKSRISSR